MKTSEIDGTISKTDGELGIAQTRAGGFSENREVRRPTAERAKAEHQKADKVFRERAKVGLWLYLIKATNNTQKDKDRRKESA